MIWEQKAREFLAAWARWVKPQPTQGHPLLTPPFSQGVIWAAMECTPEERAAGDAERAAEQHGGSDPRRGACRITPARDCPLTGCRYLPCARFDDHDPARWTGAPWSIGALLTDPPPGRWAGFEPAPIPRVDGRWSEGLR